MIIWLPSRMTLERKPVTKVQDGIKNKFFIVLFSKSQKILRESQLNPHCFHQFTGYEALFDCTVLKVRMQGMVLLANLATNFAS